MAADVRRLRGTVRTQRTLIGLLPCVRPPVLGEVALVAEFLVTEVAAEPPVAREAEGAAAATHARAAERLPRQQRGTRTCGASPASRLRFELLACTAHPTIQPATLSPYERNPEYSQPALQQKVTHMGLSISEHKALLLFISFAFVFTTLKLNDLAPGIPKGYTSHPDLTTSNLLASISLPFAPPSFPLPLPPPLPSVALHNITGAERSTSATAIRLHITGNPVFYEIYH